MLLYFAKMHGLGNDFVVIDLITQKAKLKKEQLQHIADRHFGIGCDQIILIEPPYNTRSDFFYRIFNADGNEVEQCGNGARCAIRFFFEHRFTKKTTMTMDCLAGKMSGKIEEDFQVTVGLGNPIVKTGELTQIQVHDKTFALHTVSMGNPHAILPVEDINMVSITELGRQISKNPVFPNETNVEFMQILNPHQISLRVYERGIGKTLACGSGAAAAVACGIQNKQLKSPVTVLFESGKLLVTWENMYAPLYTTGTATFVFTGRFNL